MFAPQIFRAITRKNVLKKTENKKVIFFNKMFVV